MAPSTVQESVTVTGEAPLIETTSSSVCRQHRPGQMQELPLNGRNWMDLAMLAPGQPAERVAAARRCCGRASRRSTSTVSRSRTTTSASATTSPGSAATRSRSSSCYQPVRCHAGSIGRHAWSTRSPSRDQPVLAGASAATSATTRFNAADLIAEARAALLQPADQHDVRRSDPPRPDALLRRTTNTSASRRCWCT